MEQPEIRPLEETPGEGSADLERLLQTAESENLQLLKLIDTEREISSAFQKQLEDTVKHSEELEESTKQLDAQAKQLHNKFKQNREICESLRKTASVLDEHEETLRKKLETVTSQQQTQILQQNKVMENYEKMWENYFKKYESLPLAIELAQIKQTAINGETCIKQTSEHITKIQTQIIEMEVEKTHMQEYLQGNPETATDCIVKMAKLYLDIEKKADATREKLSELKNKHGDFSAAIQPKPTAEPGIVHQDPTNAMLQEKETQVHKPESEMHKTRQKDITEAEEIQCDDPQFIKNRTNVADNQANNKGKENIISDMATIVSKNQVTHIPRQLPTYSQIPLSHQQQQPRVEVTNGGTESLQQNSETPSSNGLPEMSTAQASPSHYKDCTERLPTDTNDAVQSQEGPPVSSSSKMPTTPVSGSTTPVRPSGNGTSAQSPLDFNQHMKYIRQVTKSPGEGFMYQGRSMYNNHQAQVVEPTVERNEPEQRNEPEIIYEAPLNDQPDISLNFFQPFTQQSKNTNQNIFQTNTRPSPKRNDSVFLNSSPGKSGAASPQQSFSFGPGATSPSPSGSNFMSSSSPGGFFSSNQAQSNNDSFNSGFSLFGGGNQSSGTNEDNSGGFSFSFGGAKSPSKSSDNSGFCLF